MRKKLMFLLVALATSIGFAQGQTRQVSGQVLEDANGEPIVGATVTQKGTSNATLTDATGNFSISAPQGATLLISSIGYVSQEVAASNGVIVRLQSDEEVLDEVIVVAYGTAKKSQFTGSAAVVTSESIGKKQSADVTKSLQGTMSGVQVVSLSGQPGTAATIRIRGVGSISSKSDPLYVVDGIPVESALNFINPQDVASITTLKDAAANSLYGARGANGVVLITTKKGAVGKVKVNYEGRTGFNERGIPPYDVVNDKGQYMELLWESLRNQGIANGLPDPAAYASNNLLSATLGFNPFTNVPANAVVGLDGKLNPNAQEAWTDNWLKDPFKKGFRSENIVSVSGGNDKGNYYMSVGHLDEASYIPASDFQRFTAKLKLEQQLASWFKAGANLSYAKTESNNPWTSDRATSYVNIFMFAQQNPPIYPIYQYDKITGKPVLDKDGNKQYLFNSPYSPGTNPLSALENDMNDSDIDYTTATVFGQVTFLKDFKFEARVSAENRGGFYNRFQTPIGGDAENVGGRNTKTANKFFGLTAQQLLTWNRSFGKHNVDVLAGHETTYQKYNTLYSQKENFLIPDNPELINAGRLLSGVSYEQQYNLESYLSRVQYDYNLKYFLSASLRRDGSSRFAPESRWGTFWSVGGAYLISNENFLKGVSAIDELKIKASYGTQGNDALLDPDGYLMYNVYQTQYEVSPDGAGGYAITKVIRGNRELKWEKSENFNAGIEFRLFDKLFGGIEYYQKITRDLLYQKPLAVSDGSPNWIFDNAITMKNNGIELELGADIIKTRDWNWQVRANLTTQKNEILELPKAKDKDGKGYVSGNYWYKVGNSIYDFYTYKSAGVDPATGKALWYAEEKDADGNVVKDIVVSESGLASRYQIGKTALPQLYGGYETSLVWKNVDFSVQGAYQVGGYGWDTQYQSLMGTMDAATSGIHADVVNRRWTTPGQITDVPRLEYGLGNQATTSDRFLVSKSFFSINNITIGYTLPHDLVKKISLEKIRMYLTCDNAALLSARQGYDPRIYISGSGNYNYTAMRTYSFGLSVSL